MLLLVICIIDIITTMIDMLVIGIVMITSIDITIFAWFQVYKRLCVTTRFGSTLSRESCACQHTSAIDRLVDLQLWLISPGQKRQLVVPDLCTDGQELCLVIEGVRRERPRKLSKQAAFP